MNITYDLAKDADRAIDALSVLQSFIEHADGPNSVAAAKAVFDAITRNGSLRMLNDVSMSTLKESVQAINLDGTNKDRAIEDIVALKSVYQTIKNELNLEVFVMEEQDAL